MRKGAIVGAICALGMLLMWSAWGIKESIDIKTAIFCGAALISLFSCMSRIEK